MNISGPSILFKMGKTREKIKHSFKSAENMMEWMHGMEGICVIENNAEHVLCTKTFTRPSRISTRSF